MTLQQQKEERMRELSIVEQELLIYLLGRHLNEGSYFGNKDHHLKMANKLHDKLSKKLLSDKDLLTKDSK